VPTTLTIVPWPEPIIDTLGHDPRSLYVETFWLPILGPTAVLLLRHLATRLEETPRGRGASRRRDIPSARRRQPRRLQLTDPADARAARTVRDGVRGPALADDRGTTSAAAGHASPADSAADANPAPARATCRRPPRGPAARRGTSAGPSPCPRPSRAGQRRRPDRAGPRIDRIPSGDLSRRRTLGACLPARGHARQAVRRLGRP
jgi:hypothetical protein